MNLTLPSFAAWFGKSSSANWPALIDRTGWVLVHSFWQDMLVALVLGLALRSLRRASPRVRYATCLGALAIVLVLPAVTWLRLSHDAPSGGQAAYGDPRDDTRDDARELKQAAAWRPGVASGAVRPQLDLAASPGEASGAVPLPFFAGGPRRWRLWLEAWLPALVAAWLIGVAAFSLRPLLSWWTVRTLRTSATGAVSGRLAQLFDATRSKLGLGRSVRVLQSGLVTVPMVAGYFRPIVLIPLAVASGLPAEQLEALFAHELAHIRRHDYLVNLVQTAVETLFFYHPATWWISFQIRSAREECCDDVAVGVCGSRSDYAQALVSLEELRGRVPATALAAAGGTLLARIRRIAGIENEPKPALGPLLAIAGLLTLLAAAALPARSAGEPPQANPTAPADGAFRVTLPDGAVLELVGVNAFPPGGKAETHHFRRIEFRNVTLHLGRQSQVEILVDGKRYTPATAQREVREVRQAAPPVPRRYRLIIARQAMLVNDKLSQNAVLTDWKLTNLDRFEDLQFGPGSRPDDADIYFTNGSLSQLDSLQKRFVKWHRDHGINVTLTFLGPNASQRYDAIRAAGDLIPDRRLRCEGTVHLVDGRPVADAIVVLRQASEPPTAIYLGRGTLRDRLDEAWTTTDRQGRFVLFPTEEDFAVAAIDARGIATSTGIELRAGRPLLLKPWARIDLQTVGDVGVGLGASRTGKGKQAVHLDFQLFPTGGGEVLVPAGRISVDRIVNMRLFDSRSIEAAPGQKLTIEVAAPKAKTK